MYRAVDKYLISITQVDTASVTDVNATVMLNGLTQDF